MMSSIKLFLRGDLMSGRGIGPAIIGTRATEPWIEKFTAGNPYRFRR